MNGNLATIDYYIYIYIFQHIKCNNKGGEYGKFEAARQQDFSFFYVLEAYGFGNRTDQV